MLYGATKSKNDEGMTAGSIVTKEPTSEDDVETSVALPADLFGNLTSDNRNEVNIGFIIYYNSKFFQPVDDDSEGSVRYFVNSRVISASIQGLTVENLINPVQAVFQPLMTKANGVPVCVFWDFSAAGKSRDIWMQNNKRRTQPGHFALKFQNQMNSKWRLLISMNYVLLTFVDQGNGSYHEKENVKVSNTVKL